ncbi:hypothetical protein NXX09_00050 [Bacteroides uniformis]|nr:hypothetical protein [Bacteroides uniformis]
MKKNIFKLFSAMVVSATVFTGCIEEVFPEDSTATSDQIGASATAIEASLNGLPSQMVQGYLVYGKQTHETDLAYPSLMLARRQNCWVMSWLRIMDMIGGGASMPITA